jgi:hypothetical protein
MSFVIIQDLMNILFKLKLLELGIKGKEQKFSDISCQVLTIITLLTFEWCVTYSHEDCEPLLALPTKARIFCLDSL